MNNSIETLDNGAALVQTNMKRRRNSTDESRRFDAAIAKQQEAEVKQMPSAAELAGQDGTPIIREGLQFFPRSPKMRVLDAMTETLNQMHAGGMGQGEAVMRTACFFLVIETEHGTRRQATYDEIADAFDLADVQLLGELAAKYLNLKMTSEPSQAKNE